MRSTALIVATLVGGSHGFQPQCSLHARGVGRGAWAPPSHSGSTTARSVMSMGATGEELGAMSYRELQAECKLRGLPSSGKKDVLLERLNADAGASGAGDADAGAGPTQDEILAAAMASDISATAAAGAASSGGSIAGEAPSLDDLLNMGAWRAVVSCSW